MIAESAVVLRTWDYSETSQTAALLTRGHGLIRALAKGSKREKSPFSGGLDIVTVGEAALILRATTDLATMTEWTLTDALGRLREDLRAHAAALYCVDIASRLVQDQDPHAALFDALVATLRALGEPSGGARLVAGFQWEALAQTGHAPDLTRDALTGLPLAPARVYAYLPDRAGLTHDAGLGGAVAAFREREAWRVRAGTVDALRSLARGEGDNPGPDAPEWRRAGRLLASAIAHLLGSEPPSTAPMVERVLRVTP